MNFTTNLARALMPVAIIAAAAAGGSGGIARHGAAQGAHLTSVQSMTANFVQTDARGRSAAGTLQLKKPGRVRFQYGSGDLLLVANGKNLTLHRLSGRAEIELAAQPDAARRAAVGIARPQGPRPDRPKQRSAGRDGARPRPVAIWLADARLPAQRDRRRAACSSTAGPRSTPRTGGPRSSCRMSATMSRCRKAPSLTPSRRSGEIKKVSFRDPFIALSGTASYIEVRFCTYSGFPPVTRGSQNPLRDER